MVDDEASEPRPRGRAGWKPDRPIMSISEMGASLDEWSEWQATLEPWDPRHDTMFQVADAGRFVLLYWAGHEYDIDLFYVETPADLFWIIRHIGAKEWRYTSARRITLLMETVARLKGWKAIERHRALPPHPNMAPRAFMGAAQERSRMTPSLRYEILKRDGYRCRACGFSVSDGAHLHVDHIEPIARGGITEPENLQTLCSACNLGKAAR